MNSLFIKTLVASTPHPSTYEKLKPYELLIGDWDFDWVGHNPDGTTWTVPGEWHFAWILEGRAIQDNWICPCIPLRETGKYPEGQYGTTIRFYENTEDCVKVLWMGAVNARINLFRVTFTENRIIQLEIPAGENQGQEKWIFKDLTDDSFTWEAYHSEDHGEAWRLTQEVIARRKNNSN